jgi:tetratricopeptide (TPR) repeat protein
MELVKGSPLTTYCDQLRLPLRQRLELFVTVCQAVQHAHQKGIIHRDLKPGNVLVAEVDGRPTPKVIDFGVAKATEQMLTDTSLGETGEVVGTPAYMSPEQADPTSMDIDTRTDVYALGVMLYELLVGSPPIDVKQFKKGAVLEMLRMVREVEPPRPSTRLSTAEDLPNIAANRSTEPARLAQALRGELDWVVMKALEKDRARRYDSANGLARDLERYLADEVVEARPPSRGYRLRKFVRRHKGQVIAASLVIMALVAGVIGTTLGMFEAKRQKVYAEEAWGRAETEKTRAEQNFATAREIIMAMGNQINVMETGQKNPKLADEARKQALDAARAQFEKFRAARPDDLTVLAQAAALHRYAGNVSRTLSEYSAALDAYTKSIQITEDLTKRFPEEPEHFITLALTLGDLGLLERLMGKLKNSAATLDRAVKLAESLPSMNFESYFRKTMGMYKFDESQLADNRRRFETFAFAKTLGWTEVDRARIAYYRGLFEDSEKSAGRAKQLLDQLKLGPDRLRQAIDPLLAVIAVDYLAVALRELDQTAEALAAHEDAVARMKAMASPNASRDELFWGCEVRRARAQTAAVIPERRAAEANDLVEVSRLAEKLVDDYPQVAFYREKLAETYLLRGELLTLLGQLEPAAAELAKSLAVSRVLIDRFGVLSDSMLVRGRTFLAIGRQRAAAGKNDEAVANWKNAAKVFELALKIDPENFHHRRGLTEADQALKPSAK